jgi:uncharacterized protein
VAAVTCPVCKRKVEVEDTPAAPFCSERCRLLDLGRWLKEEYAVPHEATEEDAGELDLVAE